MSPPPLPGSDDITTIPYGKRDNFCLAILIFIRDQVGNLLLYQQLEQLIKEEDEMNNWIIINEIIYYKGKWK